MSESILSSLLEKIPSIEHAFNTAKQSPPEELSYAKQVHGTVLLDCTLPLAIGETLGDGLYTEIPGKWIGVQTADCMPVLFASKTKTKVGAVHAGWRGLCDGILVGMIEKWNSLGIRPKDIAVAIGPSIGPCCFEISRETLTRFDEKWGWMWAGSTPPYYDDRNRFLPANALNQRDATYAPQGANNLWLDLKRIAKLQLFNAGVPDVGIDDTSICTYCGTLRLQGEELRAETNDFASYRRATHLGVKASRQWSVIRIRS